MGPPWAMLALRCVNGPSTAVRPPHISPKSRRSNGPRLFRKGGSTLSATEFQLPISVRLNQTLAERVRAIAERDCTGISSTVRRLLASAVAQEQAKRTERREAGDER